MTLIRFRNNYYNTSKPGGNAAGGGFIGPQRPKAWARLLRKPLAINFQTSTAGYLRAVVVYCNADAPDGRDARVRGLKRPRLCKRLLKRRQSCRRPGNSAKRSWTNPRCARSATASIR